MMGGDTTDIVLQIAREFYNDGVQKHIFFSLFDVAFGSDSFKSLQGFLHLLLCLAVRKKERETETTTFRNIGDDICDGEKGTTSVPRFSKTWLWRDI